jgi:2-polyprenyl-3-methyl-5-hydroxy-6-metoxy-1,4-benzoquinol methylase
MKKNYLSVKSFDKSWSHFKQKENIFSASNQIDYFINEQYKIIKKFVPIFPGMKVLHCGCGTGQWSIPFAIDGAVVTNIDLSANAIHLTKTLFEQNGLKGKYKIADINNLPFENASFDFVISFGLLEHFENIDVPISEMSRVLKPHGYFLADVIPKRLSLRIIEDSFLAFQIFINRLINLKFKKIKDFLKPFNPDFFENSFSIKIYTKTLEKNNFNNIQVRGIRFYPFFSLPPFLDKFYSKYVISLFLWKILELRDVYFLKRISNIVRYYAQKK